MEYKFSEDIIDVINQKTATLFEKIGKEIPDNFLEDFKKFHSSSRDNTNLVKYIIHKKLKKIDIDEIILLQELKEFENDEEKIIILWDYIHSIYLLHEYALPEPNKEILSSLVKNMNIDDDNKQSLIVSENNESLDEDENIFEKIKEKKEFKMFNDIFQTIIKNMDIDTSNTNTAFVNDIIDDLKTNINNSDGVDDLFNSTKNIGEKYKNMFDDGKITMNDLVSGMMGILSNPKNISESIKDINVKKLPNMNSIMSKLANEVGNSEEIKKMVNSDVLKNMTNNKDFNPMDIISNVMNNFSEDNKEESNDNPLTTEQISEMEDFYSKLNIGK
jgi:hypothetical protein